jgi:hypothetical protein
VILLGMSLSLLRIDQVTMEMAIRKKKFQVDVFVVSAILHIGVRRYLGRVQQFYIRTIVIPRP